MCAHKVQTGGTAVFCMSGSASGTQLYTKNTLSISLLTHWRPTVFLMLLDFLFGRTKCVHVWSCCLRHLDCGQQGLGRAPGQQPLTWLCCSVPSSTAALDRAGPSRLQPQAFLHCYEYTWRCFIKLLVFYTVLIFFFLYSRISRQLLFVVVNR